MSLYATCPCGIPEGLDMVHLRTDCPHYGASPMTDTPPAGLVAAEQQDWLRQLGDALSLAAKACQTDMRDFNTERFNSPDHADKLAAFGHIEEAHRLLDLAVEATRAKDAESKGSSDD
jgi:hypothetical protein